jgi:NAD(P)-dependent dehydrogenase (short-subunit alcohol dehydrogenase family)
MTDTSRTDHRTILITGATDGLGRALATRLAVGGSRVILHGRDRSKLARVAVEISERFDVPEPPTVVADLADLSQVHRLSYEVSTLTDRLDGFVSNAGIGAGEPESTTRQVSADGYELRFAVNYLAGFDLTLRLLPLLRVAGAGSRGSGSGHGPRPARIVYVASLGQAPIDFDDVMIEHDYSGTRAYGQSKLAQITSGFLLAERLRQANITVNSLHPATFMPTKIVLQSVGRTVDSLETGTASTLRLINDPGLANVTGAFFDRTRRSRADASAYDPEVQNRLWKLSLELTGAPDLTAPRS